MSSFNAPGADLLSDPAPATVRVFELLAPGTVRAGVRAVPDDGVLLRVETTGVCGTDHHFYAGRIPIPLPCLLGHEVVGRLERLPDGHGLVEAGEPSLGDRVLIAPGVPCGDCDGCAREARCLDRPCYGMTMTGDGLTGGFSPLMELLPGTRVYRVPERVPAQRAVFAEPMACVLSALRKAFGPRYVPAGMDGIVLGFGALGVCAAVALAAGGGVVTVVEPDPTRRALATELGFRAAPGAEHVSEQAGVVVDAAGTPNAFASAFELLAWGGTLVELGNFADLGEAAVRPSEICLRDLRVIGSGETLYDDFGPAIGLVAATPVPLAAAVTDVHDFDGLADPARLFHAPATGKAMVRFA